jgi:hypothetical protein
MFIIAPVLNRPTPSDIYSWLCLWFEVNNQLSLLSRYWLKNIKDLYDAINQRCRIEFEMHINMDLPVRYYNILSFTAVDIIYCILPIVLNEQMEIINNAKAVRSNVTKVLWSLKSWRLPSGFAGNGVRTAKNCKGALSTSLQVGLTFQLYYTK